VRGLSGNGELGQRARNPLLDSMVMVSDRLPRGAFTIALLGIALGACGLLAWQAHSAAASHRTATEAVLRDYAGLAANELLRRSANEVGYRGHWTLVQALMAAGADRAALVRSADPTLRRATSLIGRTFVFDEATRTVAFDGADDQAAAVWLSEHVTAPKSRAPYAVLHTVLAGRARVFVLAPARAGGRSGYEVKTSALASFVEAAAKDPLLPMSLGHGQVGNDHLALTVRDPAGQVVFKLGPGWSGSLRVRRPADDSYSGSLLGFTAEAEIDPAAAPDLVIGGLPGSRLPQVLGLLGLAAALLAAALFQLQRERDLERARNEFVAGASHELRTPLAQIRMFAETLRLGRVRTDAERDRSLEIIDREARRLSCLVENLLQFSHSGRKAKALVPEAHDLGPLVTEVVESFGPVAAASGARVSTALAPGLCARVEADAWRQILLNLLDNAVKYGPAGQEIAVTLEAAEGRLRLSVEDEGPGIPAAERDHVFERFRRLERDRASAATGTGLGLAVVRELVASCGGRCAVESGKRGGARLVVDLPAVESGTP